MMAGCWIRWAAAVLAALFASAGVTCAALSAVDMVWMVSGWAVASASSGIAVVLNRMSIGRDSKRFLLYGLLGNGVRFMAVVALAAGAFMFSGRGHVSFAIALVISYLALMCFEVWTLHSAGPQARCCGKTEQGIDGN